MEKQSPGNSGPQDYDPPRAGDDLRDIDALIGDWTDPERVVRATRIGATDDLINLRAELLEVEAMIMRQPDNEELQLRHKDLINLLLAAFAEANVDDDDIEAPGNQQDE